MELINTLLEITVYSVIIFAAVMLFKRLLRDKLSPALHLAIWALLILRLALPVTFESAVHFFAIPVETQTAQTVSSDALPQAQQHIPAVQPAGYTGEMPEAQPEPFSIHWQDALLAVWVIGMAVHAAIAIYGYFRIVRQTRQNAKLTPRHLYPLLIESKTELGIRSRVNLRVQKYAQSPALLFPSTILIPEDVPGMDRDQIKMVLMHELIHFKRKDHCFALLLLLLRVVYWFNPIVRIAEAHIRSDMETVCDASVVKYLGSSKATYARTLLSLCHSGKPQIALGMALGSARKSAEQRIRGIYMKQKSKRSIKLAAALLACAIGVCCFTTACQPAFIEAKAAEPTDAELPLSETPAAEPLPEATLEAIPEASDEPDPEASTEPWDTAPGIIEGLSSAEPVPEDSEPVPSEGPAEEDVPLDKEFFDKSHDILMERDAEQDRQKIADIAVEMLKEKTGADPKAYFVDGAQLLFDENDSICTDCHVLLDNGDYYYVQVVYPGYTVWDYWEITEEPFLSDEEILRIDFDVSKIY